ncbi:hypothetical protein [Proteus mirabilis]|uniref:hypothetical protein n=1 Tax=Proteus mirabilis TaxID=584 RepID=UPI0034D6B3FD
MLNKKYVYGKNGAVGNLSQFDVSSTGFVNVRKKELLNTNDIDNYIRKEIQSTFMELKSILADFRPDYDQISTILMENFNFSFYIENYNFQFNIVNYDLYYSNYSFGFTRSSKNVKILEDGGSNGFDSATIIVGPYMALETFRGNRGIYGSEFKSLIEVTELKHLFNFLNPQVMRLNVLLQNYNSIITRFPFNQIFIEGLTS